MHSFLGIPYIDVRVSFNSFIPKHLDENIATKLVDYYLKALESTPESHDKVEFDIVFSCYDFSTPNIAFCPSTFGWGALGFYQLRESL